MPNFKTISDRVKALAVFVVLGILAAAISWFVAADFTPYIGSGVLASVASVVIAYMKSDGVDYIVNYVEYKGYDVPGLGKDVDGDGMV